MLDTLLTRSKKKKKTSQMNQYQNWAGHGGAAELSAQKLLERSNFRFNEIC